MRSPAGRRTRFGHAGITANDFISCRSAVGPRSLPALGVHARTVGDFFGVREFIARRVPNVRRSACNAK